MKKRIFALFTAAVMLAAVFALAGCSSDDTSTDEESSSGTASYTSIYTSRTTFDTSDYSDDLEDGETHVTVTQNPVATIVVKDYGTITVELYYEQAPTTVENFIYLANSGYYDGLIFHRVIDDFVIQGGDPDGDGTGGPGYTILGEFALNGIDNDISHVRGVISMARSSSYDSAGSQFFICQADCTYLDGYYAAFGEVIDGMDVVDDIAAVETDDDDKPVEDIVIESITVETYGVEYPEPETIS